MFIWRIWQLRSDLVHGKEVRPPEASTEFLDSYMKSTNQDEIIKGKMPMDVAHVIPEAKCSVPALSWPPPPPDRVALSVDGSFLAVGGTATTVMILRRHDGSVIFAVYIFLFGCNDALEVEIHALMHGIVLAIQYSDAPIIIQSDFSEALTCLSGDGLLRSAYGHFFT